MPHLHIPQGLAGRCNCNTQTKAAGAHFTHTSYHSLVRGAQPNLPHCSASTGFLQPRSQQIHAKAGEKPAYLFLQRQPLPAPGDRIITTDPRTEQQIADFKKARLVHFHNPHKPNTPTDPALMSSALQTRALTSTQQLQSRKSKETTQPRSLSWQSCQVLTQEQHSSLLWPATSN